MKPALRLSAEQRRRLRDELRLRGLDAGAAVRPRPDRELYPPLSFAQQRLWFLDQLEPSRSIYNLPLALLLRGRLDVAALAGSLQEIVRRHEALRTTFAVQGERPVQAIAASLHTPLPVVDLTALPPHRREELARVLFAVEAARPFDLARGPLLRVLLLRLETERHAALLTLHHIVADGWSMGVLIGEVGVLYTAAAQGLRSPLPELSVQFADFAVWQREWLVGERMEREVAWWRERLAGAPTVLDLPSDRPRPANQSFRGGRVPVRLGDGVSQAVAALARQSGGTVFLVLLAAFQAFLARITGQEDLVVGSPVANRERPETHGMIGFFVNFLVLRGQPAGDLPFVDWLARVRDSVLPAYDHQELPFEKLVEELQPERSLAHTPLFQVQLAFQNTRSGRLDLPGLTLEPIEAEWGGSRFDLTVSLGEGVRGLTGFWEYSADLFDATTVARMAGQLEELLAGAVAHPQARLCDLPLLSEAERHALLLAWNDSASRPEHPLLHEILASRAAEAPESVAVVFAGTSLTYGELDRLSNRMARHLATLGVGPEVPVGLLAERSLEMVVGFFGILKAGGIYIPLDPTYPAERLAAMLEDSGILVLLSQEGLAETLPGFWGFTVLLDPEWVTVAGESDEPLSGQVSLPDTVADVIYTSGSTGRPKAVGVTHRGLANLAAAQVELFGLGSEDRVLQFASPGFDASIWEIALAVGAGAALVLAPQAALMPGPALESLLRSQAITLATLPPSALANLSPDSAEKLADLRTLVVAGEACPPDLARRWSAGRRFFDAYGPTETTVCATAEHYGGEGRLTIGRPLVNFEVYVLDRRRDLLPIGSPGEICAGGPGLARGYLGRPDLTAERFIPHPFAQRRGARLYRTGDLAVHLADGRLDFLGRIDHQVKVRGFRIEPGEIEAALRTCPGVQEAVVALRQDLPGGPGLAAFLVLQEGVPLAPEGLREQLRECLPEHMVPTAWSALDRLPLTSNGKVDRQALGRMPLGHGGDRHGAFIAPRTPFEEMVAGLFASLFGVERVSLEESFFDLGGHSLLATQLVSRIRAAFGIEVSLQLIFEKPTVATLSAALELRWGGGSSESAHPPLLPMTRAGEPPLSFAQERLWFMACLAPQSPAYNMPLALRLRGRLDVSTLARAVEEVVRRHEALRTTFPAVAGRPVQRIASPSPVRLPLIELSGLPSDQRAAEARRLVAEDALRPFDLEAGPLLRLALARLDRDEHLALVNVHHIVSDGWSTALLVRELTTLYAAFQQGLPSPLPELPVQYADFAAWQRQRLSGEALATQLAWWRDCLADEPPPLELPTDRPLPAVQSFRGGSASLTVPPPLAEELNALGRRQGATLFMVLLAVWQMLLSRYSGQEDLVVGAPIAGRDHRETEGLIGLFLNTLILRTRLGGNPSFNDLLERVRETALGAYSHREVPFEKLVEELRPRRDLARHPFFDVMLNLANTPAAHAEIPGLEVLSEPTTEPSSKFALTLYAFEGTHGILFNLVYQTALFDASRAVSILDQLVGLLEQVAAEPERPVRSFSLVTRTTRALLPDPTLPLPQPHHDTVPALVEDWARRTPQAPAVRQGDRDWSYAELVAATLSLARCLAERAEPRGEVVAVSGPPSFGLIVAMLAVLRSGATMLTVDPSLPPARQRRMVQEAAVRRWLQVEEEASAGATRPWEPDGPTVFSILAGSGRMAGTDQQPDDAPLPPLPSAEEPAYIFFTSGTTGTPKGVLGSHLGLGHFLAWQRETFGVGPGDRCAQLTALSFDVLLRDVFLALTSGATLCLPDAATPPAAQVLPWLEREGITVIHTLPAVVQSWIGSLERPLPLPALRCVFFAGEPLTGALVRRWRQTFPGEARLVNLYGPTETTLAKCFFVVPAEPAPGVQPVGYPLPETQALVLGPEDRLCGVSEPGEIVLRTPFRTLGYLNASEEERNRFVPNPFRDDSADLIYRSGDRGRYRPDGALEILGRLDDQVKVRGVRVEPGEIEVALVRHPAVAAAAVVARADRSGEKELVAYVARAEGRAPAPAELRDHLRQELPEPLLPAAFVVLDALPRTATGKIDRRALPAPEAPAPRTEHAAPRTALERTVAGIWQEALRRDYVGLHDNFFDLGGHSLLLAEVHAHLSRLVTGELPLVELFRHPTVSALARYLESRTEASAMLSAGQSAAPSPRPAATPSPQGRAIAIIGMAGRFPGAADVEQFWRNLCNGVEALRRFNDEELVAAGVDPALLASPRYVKAGMVIDSPEMFDAAFFGFAPREAEILDPQHRLFLECAWETLERAGYDPQRYADPIGVYAGVQRSNYVLNLYSHPQLAAAVGHASLKHGTDKDYITTRTSYKLGLRGPSITVQTTCSTSLVAVHLACQAILAGECRMALAGGVSVRVPQAQGYLYEEGDILSPDGHTRTFDAAGRGTVPGNGLALVLLKRLEDALVDGDTIHAVIRGTAINNDGADRVGYTAPGIDGQAAVIAAAQRAAGVDPETITYVEGHGTATALGDPIEVAALTRAFRDGGATRQGFCALGSVKTNVGHLDTAAGVTGLIKTALALKHGLIPPSLHFECANPNIDFAGSPFYVNTTFTEWRTGGTPRRAGVSSFGIGGTNAHAVLEEAPPAEPSGPSRPWQLLLLSARTPAALDAATARLADHLECHPEVALADAAYTLQVGRRAFEHRRALVCRDREDALAALRSPERWMTGSGEPGGRPVAFLFPGQGAQHAGMGRELYETEPVFRETVDSCAALLETHLGLDLRRLLFPPREETAAADSPLTETRFAQPALFVVEYALARLWMEWGIRPAAMIGHSLGEYVAACLAGVFTLPDALHLIAARGRLMQQLPPGGMLTVSLPEPELRRLLAELAPELSLAALNAPALCSVSGPLPAIDQFAARLAERGTEHRRLHTSHAFHSAMMEPALRPFAELAGSIELQPPRLRYLSNLTGTWVRAEEATDPGYWARHLREPVRFSAGISTLLAEPGLTLLEAGPGRSLSALVRQHADTGRPVIGSLRHPREEDCDPAFLLRSLGRLWLAGVEPDWSGFYARERRRRIPLPTYPFERLRFWVEMARPGLAQTAEDPLPDRAQSVADLRGRLKDPRSAELLERLLALEPGLRVILPPAAEIGTAPEPGPSAERAMVLAGRRRPDLSTPWQEPRTDVERRIAAVWEDLLGIHGIGVFDDFFELGGHSLLATRLVSRLREAFHRELPLDALFAGPTIARLAARLESEEPALPEIPPIERVSREDPLPLSFAQQRLLFLHVLAPGDVSYNQPIGLRLTGPLEPARLCGALRRLVARHEVLRTTYSLAAEQPLQRIASTATVELPVLDLSRLARTQADREALSCAVEQAQQPFDLFQGPVLRAALLRLRADEHVLVVAIHHIAVDGWSWGVFCREMAALYERGDEAGLPRLPVQYADFALWQRRWLQGKVLDRQLEHWRGRLAGLPPVELPADHARPAVRSGRGAVLSMAISSDLVDSLRDLGRQEDATLFMTLLAGFFVLLRSCTRRDVLSVGTDIANRTRAELEGLMGLFVNQLVLTCDLKGNPTFREVLQRARRETLEAYAHQDAPFDRLVEMLNPVRDMSRTPLFQVKLVLQNTPFETQRLRGLSISRFEVPRRIVKFDLLLNLLEGKDGIAGSVEYSTDLFEASTIARLLDDFVVVLRAVSERPDARLGEIEALLAGRAVQEEEQRDRERRSVSLARARRQVVVAQPAS